ncbi:MAG: ABC transporter permease subunit [Actinomycetota bacterium]|nr:ABC transporter permease subunit [Actinomycetota bacterium]
MSAWTVVLDRELRDLWLAGRGLLLMLAISVLLGVTSYLVASNQALNFLEQREAVSLTLQVAVALGGLLVLLGSADSISGERERGTLESLLVTPVSRRSIVVAKAAAALSMWVASFTLTVGYVWYFGRGVGVVLSALSAGLLVGTLLALFLAGLGVLVSSLVESNRLSLSITLFALLALYTPTQMPMSAQQGWFGDLLLHVDPFTAGVQALGNVVVNGQSLGQQAGWLVGPVVAAAFICSAAVGVADRLTLGTGDHP